MEPVASLITDPEDSRADTLVTTTGPAGEPPLTARVVRGAAWVFVGKIVGRGLQLITVVVLARLLTPEDFGLFGIVMLAVAALETFSETGFGTALIQRKDNTEAYLDTAWTVQVIRGFALAGIMYAVAPAVAWFFNEPRAVPLLRMMCFVEVLRGFRNIGIIYFRKELQFHKQVAYNLLGSLASVAVGIPLAFCLRSVWALVWAALAGASAGCLFSYVLHPYRPRPRFQTAQALELFRFGRWLLGMSVVVFISTNLDRVVLGKVLGTVALGLYHVAYMISIMPATQVTHLTNAVMMPTYAKLQTDRRRLGNAFSQVFEVVMSLAVPLSAFVMLTAPQIVLGLLGPQWEAAIVPLRILAIAGLIRAIAATGGPLFVGAGHPHMDFWMNLGRASIIALLVYPFTKWLGVPGAALAVVLGLAATLPIWVKVRSIAGVSGGAILRSMAPGFVLAGLVVIAVWTVRLLDLGAGPLLTLLLQGAAAVLLCGAGAVGAGKWFNRGVTVYALKAWRATRTA